jgi:hypothetical protein
MHLSRDVHKSRSDLSGLVKGAGAGGEPSMLPGLDSVTMPETPFQPHPEEPERRIFEDPLLEPEREDPRIEERPEADPEREQIEGPWGPQKPDPRRQ